MFLSIVSWKAKMNKLIQGFVTVNAFIYGKKLDYLTV